MTLTPDARGCDGDDASDTDAAEVVAGQESGFGETVFEFDDEDDRVRGKDRGKTRRLRIGVQ